MREQTRSYTYQLPRLTLADIRATRRLFAEGARAVQKSTSKGKLSITLDGIQYLAEIGGKTLPLRVSTTQAGYGVRYWWQCPYCHNRSASLFIGAKDLACRKCWGLNYASQSEGRVDRMRRTVFKKRAELWPDYKPAESLFNHPCRFPKPKGMRWKTFEVKRAELLALEERYWKAYTPIVQRLTGIIKRKAGKAADDIGWEL